MKVSRLAKHHLFKILIIVFLMIVAMAFGSANVWAEEAADAVEPVGAEEAAELESLPLPFTTSATVFNVFMTLPNVSIALPPLTFSISFRLISFIVFFILISSFSFSFSVSGGDSPEHRVYAGETGGGSIRAKKIGVKKKYDSW